MIENQTQENLRAFLLAVHLKSKALNETMNSLAEIESLAVSLDFEVMGKEIQSRDSFDPKTYIGTGKLNQVKERIEEEKVDLVLFDHDLSPNQGKFLEKYLGCMVWDRTQLILEIFANHARTPEARDQVELAQLQYMLPRLVGLWAHLDREKGGIGTSKGTGEKQINIDRTIIWKRIAKLEKSLKRIAKERKTQSQQRQNCFLVGVVGYTNAGKTTLVNSMTGADLMTEDKLFATLDSATRLMDVETKPNILISDTVGFIKDLPHNLVASFRTTLSVVKEADLILHVVDASSPNIETFIETTCAVLKEIQAEEIPQLMVVNKIDLVEDPFDLIILKKKYPNAHFVSSFDSDSIGRLKGEVTDFFTQTMVEATTHLSYENSFLLSRFYQLGKVENVEYLEDGIYITHKMTPGNQRILHANLGDSG